MLEGIRILDFTNYLPGPYATQRLAELGAEVIKIESLEGDPARHTGVKRNGTGVVYLANNRGKMSFSVNLKRETGREVMLRLIEKADVILESFRPGIMKKFGLDYESVKISQPDIIYCSITGYGEKGKWAGFGSHDINYLALSGVLAQLKDGHGRPVHPSITLADYFGSFAANERVLAALLEKERTGKGSYHCLSITDTMVSMMGNHLMIYEEGEGGQGISLLNGDIINYGIYETKDGRFMALGALEPKFWLNFCMALGREEWVKAHFSSKGGSNPISNEISEIFLSRNFEEWVAFSQKVDCCLTPILETGELEEYPYFKQSESIYRNELEQLEVNMHAARSNGSREVPQVGEHMPAILEDLLGMSKEEVKKWKESQS